MREQGNMFQLKEQDRTPGKLNETDVSSLSDKEVKVMVIKMLTKLGRS